MTAMPPVRTTSGELLPNGVIIDLVGAADREGLDLICWKGNGNLSVEPVIECGGVIYHPPCLDPSVREAMNFPAGALEYGSIPTLFTKICGIYQKHAEMPEDQAAFVSCWTLSSWLFELMLIPLTLCVMGGRMLQIYNLFRLSGSLCRRGLPVAELSRRLPLFLQPTLLVNDPALSRRSCSSWRAGNCHGLYVAGPGSSVCSLSCAKAVVLQPGDSPQLWGEQTMFLMLPTSESPPLSSRILADIAAEFQPQLEMFRLRTLSGTDPLATKSQLSKFELARSLGACIPEDPGIVRTLTPLLESHQQDLQAHRARDPKVAIVEAAWAPGHKPGKMTITEVSERVNAIMTARGEICQYNAWEIGWLLRKMGLHTRRNRDSKVLQFSSEVRLRLHQLAREFSLQLPSFKDCPECKRGK